MNTIHSPKTRSATNKAEDQDNPPNFEAWTKAVIKAGMPGFSIPNATQYKKYSMVDSVGLMSEPNILGSVSSVLKNWGEISCKLEKQGVARMHTYIESENASLRIRQKKYTLDELHTELKNCLKLDKGGDLLVSAIPAGEVLYNANAVVKDDGSLLAEFCKGKNTPARGAAITFSLQKNNFNGICFPRLDSKDPTEINIALKLLNKLPKTYLNEGTYETFLPGYYEFGVVKMPDGRIRLSFYDYTNDPFFIS
jgi:hypothetical protein